MANGRPGRPLLYHGGSVRLGINVRPEDAKALQELARSLNRSVAWLGGRLLADALTKPRPGTIEPGRQP